MLRKANTISEVRKDSKDYIVPSKDILGTMVEIEFVGHGKTTATVVQVLSNSITYALPADFDFGFWKDERVEVKINGEKREEFLYI